MFPIVIERLRGAPLCLQDRVASLPNEVLICREGDQWSIQEIAGHLLDLEPLWMSRLEDFMAGRETLQPADLTNRKTHEANHNAGNIESILSEFRLRRSALVRQMEELDEVVIKRTALHPRLREPIGVVQMSYVVAEHDVHHLAQITELIRTLTK